MSDPNDTNDIEDLGSPRIAQQIAAPTGMFYFFDPQSQSNQPNMEMSHPPEDLARGKLRSNVKGSIKVKPPPAIPKGPINSNVKGLTSDRPHGPPPQIRSISGPYPPPPGSYAPSVAPPNPYYPNPSGYYQPPPQSYPNQPAQPQGPFYPRPPNTYGSYPAHAQNPWTVYPRGSRSPSPMVESSTSSGSTLPAYSQGSSFGPPPYSSISSRIHRPPSPSLYPHKPAQPSGHPSAHSYTSLPPTRGHPTKSEDPPNSPQRSHAPTPDNPTTAGRILDDRMANPLTGAVIDHAPMITPSLSTLSSPSSGMQPSLVLDRLNVWIGAENALQHLKQHHIRLKIAEEFSKWNIKPSQYTTYAGFDNSLLQEGIGYLEQIHVFTSVDVPPTSPLLSSLGRIFSPFSSILYAKSSHYRLPVYKTDHDETRWEFDELVFETAAKFADRGTSAAKLPTVISLCQDGDGGATSGSGTQSGRPDKGKGREGNKRNTRRNRDQEGEGEDGSENGDDNRPGENPDEPPDSPTESEATTRPINVSFNVSSEIYSTKLKDESDPMIFQHLTLQGDLTIYRSTPAATRVEFTSLKFGSLPAIGTAYHQDHLRITVDSRCKLNFIKVHKPQRTLAFDRENKVIAGTKTNWTFGGSIGAALGLTSPRSVTLAGTAARTAEQSAGVEKKSFTSRITQQELYGVAWWGFDVDDPYERKGGINLSEDILPSATFDLRHTVPSSNVKDSGRVDVEVASYWSIVSRYSEEPNWIDRILSYSSSEAGDVPFSNLCQILVLSIPLHPPQDSSYTATVRVADRPQNFYSSISSSEEHLVGPAEFSPKLTKRATVTDYGDLVRESILDLSSIRLARTPSVTFGCPRQAPTQVKLTANVPPPGPTVEPKSPEPPHPLPIGHPASGPPQQEPDPPPMNSRSLALGGHDADGLGDCVKNQ